MKLRRSAILFALLGSPALAQEKPGLPQMDPEWFANQLAWLAISFAALYFIVSRYIAPKVSSVFDSREAAITEAIAAAEKLKANAMRTRGNVEAKAAESRAQAAGLIAAAQEDAAKDAAAAHAKLAAELDTKAGQARARLNKALAKARQQIGDAAGSLAAAMSEKLLSTRTTVAKKKAS